MKYEKLESLSNLAYPLVGLIGYALHREAIFLVVMIQMGVGSFLFHKYKENNPDVDKADWFAINLMLNMGTAYLIGTSWAWVVMGIASIVYGFFLVKRIGNVYLEVAISAVPCIVACFVVKGWLPTMVILVVFLAAIILRKQDNGEDQSTHHDSWGHSAWHGLTAVMNYLIWFYPNNI